jgi:hypothetical protein
VIGKTAQDDFELNLAEYREEENSHTANFFNLLNELRHNASTLEAWLLLNHTTRGDLRGRVDAFVKKVRDGIEGKIRWDGQPWAGLNAEDVPIQMKWEYAHNALAAGIEPWVGESRSLCIAVGLVPLRTTTPFMVIDSMLKEEGLLPEEVSDDGQETHRDDKEPEVPRVLVPTGPGRWGPKPLLRAGAPAARGADLDRGPRVGPGERGVPGGTLAEVGRPRRPEADPPGGERGAEPGEGDEPDEPREP